MGGWRVLGLQGVYLGLRREGCLAEGGKVGNNGKHQGRS